LPGRYLAYTRLEKGDKSKQGLWILPLFGDRMPFSLAQTQFEIGDAAIHRIASG
jgi:hypothetical protein